MDPIKYLMKYFNINAYQDTLAGVQGLGESIARLEGAVENLNKRVQSIKASVQPARVHHQALRRPVLG
jgi:hypothetical protein